MSDPRARAAPLSGRTTWTRSLETPLRAFLETETGSAAILLTATIAALVWANVHASSYRMLWGTELSIRLGGHGISQDLRHWVNAGLMTFFFFVWGSRRAASSTSASCANAGDVRGPTDAPVTIVEYGDFECPYCGLAEPIVRRLVAEHGDVRFVWRHLPLNDVHPDAQLAAEAAEAAADQGAF